MLTLTMLNMFHKINIEIEEEEATQQMIWKKDFYVHSHTFRTEKNVSEEENENTHRHKNKIKENFYILFILSTQ